MANYRGLSDAQNEAFWRLMFPASFRARIAAPTLAALERRGLVKLDSDGNWVVPADERRAFFAWVNEEDRKRLGLPVPECRYGYTRGQLEEVMGDRLEEFSGWMYGQTFSLCEGRAYDHDTKDYEPACGGVAHGPVYYETDVKRFLDGRPIVD